MSPEIFKQFADVLPEPMALISDKGHILATNRGLGRELNLPEDRLVGRHLADISVDPVERIDQYVRAAARTREPLIGSLTLKMSGGETKSYRSTGAVVEPKSDTASAIILLRLVNKAQTNASFILVNQRIDQLTREIGVRNRFEQRHRQFMRDMLFSVTEGKLILCHSDAELPARLQAFGTVKIASAEHIYQVRRLATDAASTLGMAEESRQDLVTAVSEAAMNAYIHAGHGSGSVYVSQQYVQIWIEDTGAGIALENLPRATLEKGFTTAGTLGHGFKMMLQTADGVWLCTGDRGTSIVIVKYATPLVQLTM